MSKVFHMGVPGGIEEGSDGADDELSWTERFNSMGPEWKAAGDGETLENNPDGEKPAVGGNTFVVVEADGDDLVHSDGKTAAKAVELFDIEKDPKQYTNLVGSPDHQQVVEQFRAKMATKLKEVRDNDLPTPLPRSAGRKG